LFVQAEDGIRDFHVTGVQTCALPILGERWIPTGVYAKFASYLFDADVKIHYSDSADDFSVTCKQGNQNIWVKYAVKSESRTFDEIGRASCRERGVLWQSGGSG